MKGIWILRYTNIYMKYMMDEKSFSACPLQRKVGTCWLCFSPQSHPRNNPILPISTKPSMQSCLFFSPITSYDEQLHPISPNLYKVVYLMVPVFFSPIPSYDKQFRLRLHKTFPKNCLMVLCLFPNIIILEPILCYDKLSPKNCLFISFCLHTQMLNSILIISKTLPSKTFNNQFQFVLVD